MAKARRVKVGTKTAARGDRNEAIRQRLLSQRQEIMDLYQHDLRVGKESGHEASEDIVDRANNAYQREFMFNLSGSERRLLRQVEGALERLELGDYGTCDHCRKPIGAKRLKAVPWARYCVECQEKEERGSLD